MGQAWDENKLEFDLTRLLNDGIESETKTRTNLVVETITWFHVPSEEEGVGFCVSQTQHKKY